MRNVLIAGFGLLFSTSTAWATSDLHERRVAGVDPACAGAYLLEQVFEGGSVTNASGQYRLICMSETPGRAEWVLAADARCGGATNACQSKRQKSAFDQIMTLTNHAERTGVIEVRLDRLVVGTKCTIEQRRVVGCEAQKQFRNQTIKVYSQKAAESVNPDRFIDVGFKEQFTLDTGR